MDGRDRHDVLGGAAEGKKAIIPDADMWRAPFLMVKSYGGDEMTDAAEKAFTHQVCITTSRTARRC